MSRSEIAAGQRWPGGFQRTTRGSPGALMSAAVACFCAVVPFPASGQLERWTLERTITIGDALDPETGLTRVGAVIIRGDRLFIAQPMEQRLRVFSVTGGLLGFIGRDGEGPGEFRSVGSMGLHEGGIWVDDPDLQRHQYFDVEGRFVSSARIRGHPSLSADLAAVRGVLVDGSRLVSYGGMFADELAKSPPDPTAVLRFDSDGVLRDTVAMIVGRSRIAQVPGEGSVTFFALPESYRSLFSVVPDGSGFVVVHRTGAMSAEPHTFPVIRFDARADTSWAVEIPYDPIRVPRTWRSRHVEDEVRDYEDWGIPERRLRQALERAYGTLKFFPPVGGVRAWADGTTWVLVRTGVDSSEWEVLDDSGSPLARVDPPPRSALRWVDGDSVWFVEHDELDIPYLVRYVIRRP